MKSIIVALALLGLGISAHAAADTTFEVPARPPELATKVIVARSSITIQGMDIAAIPTNVVINSTQNYTTICVQNFDNVAKLACSESAIVTWLVSQANVGTMIYPSSSSQPAVPVCFPVVAGKNFFCISSSATTSRAGVTRIR